MNQLKRVLNLPLLTFYGTGMILGAGIYTIIGKAAGVAQESLWLGFILAAIAALMTALSYAELATMFPRAGAEYIYLKNAFPKHRWASIASGLMMAFAGASTASTVAVAFTGYLETFISVPALLAAGALLIVFTILNIIGLKESSWVNVIFTLIEVGGLILFIYLGIKNPKFGEALSAKPNFTTLSSAALIIFAYFGFENTVNLIEETKKPERNIPLAILLSLGISTTLYILVALSALALLPPAELAQSNATLTDAAKQSSPRMASILGGIALFSTANTALIALVTTSRILYGMSHDYSLPASIAKVSGKRKTPWVAALVVLTMALLLIPLGKVEVLASVSSFATMIAFTAINLALIFLRFQKPHKKRPFKVALSIKGVPVFPVLGALLAITFCFQFEGTVYTVGFLLIAIAVATGLWMQKQKSAPFYVRFFKFRQN